MIAITRGHAQIFVGVVTYIGAYNLLGTYYLSTYCYKRMCSLTRLYGNMLHIDTAAYYRVDVLNL